MQLQRLWLSDFRSYSAEEMSLSGGFTVVRGPNGSGKTNVLEAIGYLVTLGSFRGAAPEALIREGAGSAAVRGEGRRGQRTLLIEAEIRTGGRGRVTVNRQPVRRSGELLELGRVTVFAPDDLALVKGSPSLRRRYLDDGLVALHPRHDALRRDFERIVRQRTRLLAQSRGRLTGDVASTLDVWDAKLVENGEALARARIELLERVGPPLVKAYAELGYTGPERPFGAGGTGPALVELGYAAPWREAGLAASLVIARSDELRRGTSLVGPHRDDLTLSIGGLPARTHASQGEQRCLALAMRLALHQAVAEEVGEPPILLLDDVFSELDPTRSRALLDHLPAGQVLLTTTGEIPAGVVPDQVVEIRGGHLMPGTPT